MHGITPYILFGLFVFLAHVVASVTGFGSNVVGLPLVALVVGLDEGKQSLIVLSSLMYVIIVARWHARIDWRQLGIMLGFATIGVPIGLYLYDLMPQRVAMILLGAFVAIVGLRNLLQLMPDTRAPRWLARLLLVAGGVVHGAFTTGGPLLIVYADQTIKHKSVFRSTLSLLWLALNLILFLLWTWKHAWAAATPRLTLVGLPFLIGGLVTGEFVHHRIDERGFRRAVSATLLLIGVLVIATAAA